MSQIDYNLSAMAAMLKIWRRRCNLTVYRVSQETGIDAHTIARMEKGEPVHSSAFLKYLEFIRHGDKEWNIIDEFEKNKKKIMTQVELQ